MTFRARPPAKVNLTLAVAPRAGDGYHPLRSVFLRIGLADELAVDFAPGQAGDSLGVEGDVEAPVEGNLVLRAFGLVRSAVGQPLPALRAHLVKRIPIGAGLAGGSSDGAAALELATRVWGIGLAPELRAELEGALGSDVPFFARGGPAALVEGRGEVVTPLPPVAGAPGILLCVSAAPLLTAGVYARYDQLAGAASSGSAARGASPANGASAATDELVAALRDGLDIVRLAARAPSLRDANDLWPAAADLAPELAGRREMLERLTGRPWLMSGSGPTLFALYADQAESAGDAERLAAALPDGTILATTLGDDSVGGHAAAGDPAARGAVG